MKKFLLTLVVLANTLNVNAVPAESQHIMLAGPNQKALEAGLAVSRKGGNVIDVAVATELALAVTAPYYASLGGGGFALIKINGKVEALDFRETGPKEATRELFATKPITAAQDGGLAVATPGVPAGLKAMHEKYGKLKWNQLFTEAIRLADQGFEVTGEWARNTNANKDRFNASGKSTFPTLRPGTLLKQKNLAKLLKDLQQNGTKNFYQGAIARDIVDSTQKAGGVLSLADMKSYKVRWLEPLKTTFEGYTINLMPPPSSGGVVIATALKLAELKSVKSRAPMSADELHLLGSILNVSFRGRSLLGDPDFAKIPTQQLLDPKYLETLSQAIKDKRPPELPPLKPEAFKERNKESTETTHFSVMDAEGNAVAFTTTLNGGYGSGVVTDVYNLALNNEIDDFTIKPDEANQFGLIQGKANVIESGKRPLSSMSPTIVEKNGETVMSLGSPGGPRIISAVFQTMYRVLASNYNMDEAIQAGRVHHQFLPNTLYVDPKRVTPDTLENLKARGNKIEESNVAKVFGIRKNAAGLLEGAFDSRGEGAAVGF